jgi:hypothetical protein
MSFINKRLKDKANMRDINGSFSSSTAKMLSHIQAAIDSKISLRHYGALAADPVSASRVAGEKYFNAVLQQEMYYDGFRQKWLSIATLSEGAGINGNCEPGEYYKRYNGSVLSAVSGPHVQKGTIIGIGYSSTEAATHTYEVMLDGIAVAELASGGNAIAFNDFVNGDFDSGIMAGRSKLNSSDVRGVQSIVRYKLRA